MLKTSLTRCRAIIVLATALACASVSAQQRSWNDIVQAAEREGNVVFYSSLVPATLEPLINAFQQKYPKIKVQNVRNIEAVLIPKIQQEQASSAAGADLVSVNIFDFYDDEIKSDQLVRPVGPNAAKYTGDAMHKGLAPIISGFPMGFAYNSDLVKEPPRSYEDFLKPEFKGALGTINASASPAVTFWYDFLRKSMPGYWEKLAAQNPKLYPSTIPMTQAVASGEIKADLRQSRRCQDPAGSRRAREVRHAHHSAGVWIDLSTRDSQEREESQCGPGLRGFPDVRRGTDVPQRQRHGHQPDRRRARFVDGRAAVQFLWSRLYARKDQGDRGRVGSRVQALVCAFRPAPWRLRGKPETRDSRY
jgi:iron(III) transport system substrate-binding protein